MNNTETRHFRTTDEFVILFNLKGSEFFGYQQLLDAIGFLVKRDYPSDYRYQPPLDKSNLPEYVALLRVQYLKHHDTGETVTYTHIPILGHAAICPRNSTSIPLDRKRDPKEPIDLEFNDLYFNHITNTFHDDTGNEYSSDELLDFLYKRHCDTARFREGFVFRLKLRALSLLISGKSVLAKSLIHFIELFLGREVKSVHEGMPTLLFGEVELGGPKIESKGAEELGDKKVDFLSVFNYDAPKRLIITFSVLMLVGYTIVFLSVGESSIFFKYFKALFSNTFLSILAGIVILFGLDSLLPQCLIWIINQLRKTDFSTKFKKVKF